MVAAPQEDNSSIQRVLVLVAGEAPVPLAPPAPSVSSPAPPSPSGLQGGAQTQEEGTSWEGRPIRIGWSCQLGT